MYVQFVGEGFWVDLHISKTQYNPDEHVLFVDRVKSVKFESKREPVAVGEDSPLEAAKKAAEAWLLLGTQADTMKYMRGRLSSLIIPGETGTCSGMPCGGDSSASDGLLDAAFDEPHQRSHRLIRNRK